MIKNERQVMGCRTGRRCEVAALPGALYTRDPWTNQPGAAGNVGRDPGVNQPGAAGNVGGPGRDPGINQPGAAGNRPGIRR
jgi:hypothetical protein